MYGIYFENFIEALDAYATCDKNWCISKTFHSYRYESIRSEQPIQIINKIVVRNNLATTKIKQKFIIESSDHSP